MCTLVAYVVDAEQARATHYSEDLEKAPTPSLADQEGDNKGKASMEVEG